MGYDMHLVNRPPAELAVQAKIDAAYRQDPIDKEAVSTLYEQKWEIEKELKSYFRLNIWGMGRYRDAMEEIGMLAWSETDHPAWPDPKAFRIPKKTVTYNGKEYQEDDEDTPEYRAYDTVCKTVRSWTDTYVMAGHKFCSNDGWIVTPPEIAHALDAWHAWRQENDIKDLLGDDQEEIDYWHQWIRFLTNATDMGGFEVW